MISRTFLILISAFCVLLFSCKKDKDSSRILEYHISVESIIAPGGGQSTTNKCFLNMYEGLAYTKSEAELNSSKVDFAYNYHGGGTGKGRLFENVKSMSIRTGYVTGFSTITNSLIGNAEASFAITPAIFDGIKSKANIESLFSKHDIHSAIGQIGDLNNRVTDVSIGKILAFTDKSGRKGFFKVADYVANVPDGDKATVQLHIKVVKE